jgi:threonine dehydrogenase-like Zn-dependent dehydrogenase
MNALRKWKSGPGNLEVQEVPAPEIGDDEILMKVWACGICGSDLLIRKDKHFYEAPVTLGHEFSGIAERVGKNVTRVKEGDRIAGDIETRSGWLGVTRDGAFASHMSIPEAQAYVYPQSVSLDHIAFTEPVVATLHALEERNTVGAGDFVVVVGPGPMGLLGAQFAKIRGARAVAVIGLKRDERRLEAARKTGVDHILYSEEDPASRVMELTDGRGADLILEASASAKGVQHAIDCARRAPEGRGGRGRISFISLWGEPITIQPDAISLFQLDISGAWSWNGPETWERAVELVSRGVFDFDSVIGGRYALEEWETAFDKLTEAQDVKAFIQPNGREWM